MKDDIRRIPVLGTPVAVIDYQRALELSWHLARGNRPAMVSACNTHLVALARHHPQFARTLWKFDLILPDGYPLVWAMNRQGAQLSERVYGPFFMRHALVNSPEGCRHFFLGGRPETLDRLLEAAHALNPRIEIAGSYSPPFREWSEEDEQGIAGRIREARADFIWVALGGGRQEGWITRSLHRHQRGVFFAVGDAFELLAGGRPFAPAWMQKHGLTWLYRLIQEPRRLGPRYLKFNSLFLYYSLRDRLLGPPRQNGIRVAFLGSRGIPARYSGFETVVENLGAELAGRGYEVTVYNRLPRFPAEGSSYRGMRMLTLPTIPSKYLDTIVHTALSALHGLFRGYDVIYLCGVGNAIIGGMLKILGCRVILNVDGADFRRAKWGTFARIWLKGSEVAAAHSSHRVIADNREIAKRYQASYGIRTEFISYGTVIRREKMRRGELESWGLSPGGYILHVSRLTPENEADLLLEAYGRWDGPLPLVIVGSVDYERGYFRKLRSMADERVLFTGARFGDAYIELSQHARFFVMPAAIEATRLVLLDQMGMGAAILYKDAPATREVVGDAAQPFDPANPIADLSARIAELAADPDRCLELGRRAMTRAGEQFSWSKVGDQYEKLFAEMGVVPRR